MFAPATGTLNEDAARQQGLPSSVNRPVGHGRDPDPVAVVRVKKYFVGRVASSNRNHRLDFDVVLGGTQDAMGVERRAVIRQHQIPSLFASSARVS